MFSLNSIKKICITGMASSFVLIALAIPSAKAVVLDSNVYARYRTVRASLLIKETSLLKDYDDLQKQIDLLQRQNDNRTMSSQIDGLSRSLDQTYLDLRQVRLDIKSLDRTVL